MPRAIRPTKLRASGSAQESWRAWCFLRMYAYQQCSSSKPNPLCRLSLSYKMPFWNPALPLLSHVLPTSCAGMYFCSYFTDIQTEAQTWSWWHKSPFLPLHVSDSRGCNLEFVSSRHPTALASQSPMVPPPAPLAGHVFPTSQRFQSFGSSVIYSWLYLPPRHRYEGALLSFLKAWFPDCQLHTSLANCCTPEESIVWPGGLVAEVKPSTVSNPRWEGNLGGSSSHVSLTTYAHTERLDEFIFFFFSFPFPGHDFI